MRRSPGKFCLKRDEKFRKKASYGCGRGWRRKRDHRETGDIFDIHSTKAKQFGFSMELEPGKKLTCCGDEPYNEAEKVYAQNSQWLLHEAFCLFGEADQFKPYEKHHSTVKDACELGERLNVENLILYHTEDKNILKRQEMYLAEGRKFYHGNLYVPEDLDVIEL